MSRCCIVAACVALLATDALVPVTRVRPAARPTKRPPTRLRASEEDEPSSLGGAMRARRAEILVARRSTRSGRTKTRNDASPRAFSRARALRTVRVVAAASSQERTADGPRLRRGGVAGARGGADASSRTQVQAALRRLPGGRQGAVGRDRRGAADGRRLRRRRGPRGRARRGGRDHGPRQARADGRRDVRRLPQNRPDVQAV